MSIEEGCIVNYNGDLYYVLDTDDRDPYITNPTKGAMFVPLRLLRLIRQPSTDIDKLVNFAFIETGKSMNGRQSLDYVGSNMIGLQGKVKQIFDRVSTSMFPMPPMPRPLPMPPMPRPMPRPLPVPPPMPRPLPVPPSIPAPMPTFAVGELVHVGPRQFSVVSVNPFAYTLSPNVSGGGGGANVIAMKKYVTKDPNLTPEGQRWLTSLYSTPEVTVPVSAPVPVSEAPIKDLSRAKCSVPAVEKGYLRGLTTMDPRTTFPLQAVANFALAMFGYNRDIFTSYRGTFEATERGERGMLNAPNREYNIAFFNMKSGIPVDRRSEAVQNATWMERIFEKVRRTGIFTTRRHSIVYRSFAKQVSSAKAVCEMPLNRFTSTTLVKRYADTWGQAEDIRTGRPNTEGFFSTIIIPAGTTGIIPLLLFPDLPLKRGQYEVLLSPNGLLRDTGFVDSGGSKIVVYLDRERCAMSINEILMMEMDGTNVLGYIQCVFGDNVTWVGATGGKHTNRRKNKKTKKQKKMLK